MVMHVVTLLSSTRPKTLLAIAATVFLSAVRISAERKPDNDVLNNGVSYFLGPLLGWTLPGIVLALVREIRVSRWRPLCYPYTYDNDTKLNQLPLSATSECFTHCHAITETPAACVISLWTKCCETTLGRPWSFPAFRCLCSATRGRQGDGSHSYRFSITLSYSNIPRSPDSEEPDMNNSPLHGVDQPRRAIQNALALIQSGKPPSLNVAACIAKTPVTEFLHTLWLELNMSIKRGTTPDAAKRLAVFVLATPRAPPMPPLLPIFLHNILPSLIDKFDNPNLGQAMVGDLELLITIISSSLMAALQLERALFTTSNEQIYPLGSSSSSMARRVALDLRHRRGSSEGKLIAQRLTSSQTFVTNFPMFKTEI
jgi:mediator of RNA polymerase II transcription subunit 5